MISSPMPDIKIAFFDIDGTLHHGDTLWEVLHKKNNTWDSMGIHYLNDFLSGKIDFQTFARLDVKAWAGLPESILMEAIREVTLFQEAITVFKHLHDAGCSTYLISNGIAQLAEHITVTHGLTGFVANPIHIENGCLTGEISFALPYEGKGVEVKKLLEAHRVSSSHALAIGDGFGDIPMLLEVGHPIFLSTESTPPPDYQGVVASSWNDVMRYLGLAKS